MEHIDFSKVLIILVCLTGAVLICNGILRVRKRTLSNGKQDRTRQTTPANIHLKTEKKEHGLVEICKAAFPVLLIVLLVRSFVFEPFQIPSGSMIPTLKPGDFILVSKFSYGLRLPVSGTRIWATGEPERGDVMVFKFPENPHINYIKRVIGLPGDHIVYRNGKLTINGHAITNTPITRPKDAGGRQGQSFHVDEQTIGSHRFRIRTYPGTPQRRTTGWTVPQGMYFVMGDNRDRSHDSRSWGFVPEKYIVGKAVYIWMNWTDWHQLPTFKYNGAIP